MRIIIFLLSLFVGLCFAVTCYVSMTTAENGLEHLWSASIFTFVFSTVMFLFFRDYIHENRKVFAIISIIMFIILTALRLFNNELALAYATNTAGFYSAASIILIVILPKKLLQNISPE